MTHARLCACLLMSPNQCQTLTSPVLFVSSIAVMRLVGDASLTPVTCIYHAKQCCPKKLCSICRTCLLEPGSKQTQTLTRCPSLSHQFTVPPKWAGGNWLRGETSRAEELLARMVGRLPGVGARAGASFSTLHSYCPNQPSLPKPDTTMSHCSLRPGVGSQLLTMQVH